jgi:hypothetical protein
VRLEGVRVLKVLDVDSGALSRALPSHCYCVCVIVIVMVVFPW